MKIIHVTEAWNGGIATYVNTLIGEQTQKHSVSLIYSRNQTTRDFDPAWYQAHGITTLPYDSSRNPLHALRIAKTLRAIISEKNPDIIHLHSTFPGVYGRIITMPASVVYCPHGWSFVQEKGLMKKTLYAVAEKFMAGRCAAVISISAHEAQSAQKFRIRSPLDVTIASGVRDAVMGSTPPAINVDPAQINIGFIGRLDYKKGFDIAVSAMRTLKRNDVHLYVLGAASRDGHGKDMHASPNIHYCGWVDNAHIDAYIRLFDAVIVPSRQEGFGLTVVEAMRNARPAIVSTAGGLPELVQNGQNGYVFESEKNLTGFLENLDKQKLKVMGAQAHSQYQKHYTAARFAEEIETLYNKVLYTRNTSS